MFLQLISKNANSFNIFSNNIFEDTILSYPFLSDQYGGMFMNLPDNFIKEVVTVFDKIVHTSTNLFS